MVAHPAGQLTTAPDPLMPDQHHRAAADRQVAHPDGAAAMDLGPHTAAGAIDHRGRCLDGKLLATGQLGRWAETMSKPPRSSSSDRDAPPC
jgi:hypothetical protein